jgi:2-haloacid dehalogenase
MVILFDLVGTLFALDRVRDVFRRHAVPDDVLPLWFARLLHVSMASTLSGRYAPFLSAGESALRQVLALRALPADVVADTLQAMQTLTPWPDARDSLAALRAAGHTLVALSNAHAAMERSLIDGGKLGELFTAVLSSDEVRHAKPHPAPYRMALERLGAAPARACMVAAHAWDVQGAAAVGLRTVWISRVEKGWGFPGAPPGATATGLADLPAIVASMG